MGGLKSVAVGAAAAALSAGFFTMPAQAAFDLHGKTLRVLVSGGVGGGVDLYARILLPFLSKYLPGHPSTVVQNLPGGGGVQGVQQLYNLGPKDGTMIATMPPGPVKAPLMGTVKVSYDLRKFRWFGSLATADDACFVWHTSPIHSLADAKAHDVPLSATGATSDSALAPLLLNALLGTRFKPISGYDGGTAMLAIARGEVAGRCMTLSSVRAARPDWLKNKLIRVILDLTPASRKMAPDAPYAADLVKTKAGRQALAFFDAPDSIQDPYILPPGTPDEIVEAYRRAFDEATADPAYRAAAAKARQHIDPHNGATVEKVIQSMYDTPSAVIAFVKKATTISGVGTKPR